MLKRWFLLLLSGVLWLVGTGSVQAHHWFPEKSFEFSGYHWQVKEGYSHPGRNYWAANNVWVDEKGWLHLAMTYHGRGWYCAEVRSVEAFGYGQFRFQVISNLEKMDPQLVFGLFLYNDSSQEEMDVEFSHWGDARQKNGLYSFYSRQGEKASYPFVAYLPDGDYSTHQIDWQEREVEFSSQYGHREDKQLFFSNWKYQQVRRESESPQALLRVHMNLWLYQGKPPQDGRATEVIIRNFGYFSGKGEEQL